MLIIITKYYASFVKETSRELLMRGDELYMEGRSLLKDMFAVLQETRFEHLSNKV